MGLAPLREGLADLILTSAANRNHELGSVVAKEVSELGCRLLWAGPLMTCCSWLSLVLRCLSHTPGQTLHVPIHLFKSWPRMPSLQPSHPPPPPQPQIYSSGPQTSSLKQLHKTQTYILKRGLRLLPETLALEECLVEAGSWPQLAWVCCVYMEL